MMETCWKNSKIFFFEFLFAAIHPWANLETFILFTIAGYNRFQKGKGIYLPAQFSLFWKSMSAKVFLRWFKFYGKLNACQDVDETPLRFLRLNAGEKAHFFKIKKIAY